MKRRFFVKASMLSGLLAPVSSVVSKAAEFEAAPAKVAPEYYEFRVYTLKDATQQKLVEDYFQQAAIPALNRMGVKNVGVFTEQKPEGQTKLYAVIPYASVKDYAKVVEQLSADKKYQQAGASYLEAPSTTPAYERIQSSFMKAFAGMPRLQVPANKPRMFELRRYESSGEAAGKKKIDMFDNQGEIAIFKRVGLTPVFFGETIIGEFMPNLTYLLTFADMEDHDKSWKAFGGDPEWKRIRAIPGYEDAKIVSRITRTFLVPTSFSQI
ncbi:NIPSNAP family containing protein [Segetibacter sp. 3557_3]|uniref:NIPSNAP family protein n=1 Tax=Segetibacter sp. 3557_3 TaxID=2547429 RepID=UPI001058F45A|nr:NIPSNAP family protein [Segetibacter sp. 3557_3]TDH21418.1 NIPSNAP family containing protein [Segetibacter sp. 3557_3]